MGTITSANAAVTLVITKVFPVPLPITGFAMDDAFTTEPVQIVEARIGVDAIASYAYTPYLLKQRITLQADSEANLYFDLWRQAMDAVLEVYTCNLEIAMPSISKLFTFNFGTLTNTKPAPDGKRFLEPQTYELTFQNLIVAPM